MYRSPILVAVAALALIACSDTTANPVAPDSGSIAAPAPVPAADRHAPQPARHNIQQKDVKGTYVGLETGVFQPATNTVLLTVNGSGVASNLGRYTSVSNFVLDVATGTTVGSVTVTAADGSTITTSATGIGLATNGISQIVEKASITGGTGRFEGVTGALTIKRTLNQSTGKSFGSISGSIATAGRTIPRRGGGFGGGFPSHRATRRGGAGNAWSPLISRWGL
jgi:hypothetical protein